MVPHTVRCSQVTYAFPNFSVLKNFNYVIPPTNMVSIIGKNGSGKTTLLRLLAGLIIPQQGEISYSGWTTEKHWAEVRKIIGVSIYPERSFNFRLTGYQNAEYHLALAGLTRAQAISKIHHMVDDLEVHDLFIRKFSELSLGQRKIFGIIVALLTSNGVLLLDEPTATLDENNSLAVGKLLRKFVEGQKATVILTTHDRKIVENSDLLVNTNNLL